MTFARIMTVTVSMLLVAACGGGEEPLTAPLPNSDGDAGQTADVEGDTPAPDTTPEVGTTDGDDPVDTDDPLADGAETTADGSEVILGDTAVDDTVGPDPDAAPDVAPGDIAGDVAADPVTFTEVFEKVLDGEAGCSGGYCHGGSAGGFTITDAIGTHFVIVNQNAIAPICGLTKLVVPGDPESSILWRRARPVAWDDGDVCDIVKMPKGPDLGLEDEEHAQLLYDWIEEGALP